MRLSSFPTKDELEDQPKEIKADVGCTNSISYACMRKMVGFSVCFHPNSRGIWIVTRTFLFLLSLTFYQQSWTIFEQLWKNHLQRSYCRRCAPHLSCLKLLQTHSLEKWPSQTRHKKLGLKRSIIPSGKARLLLLILTAIAMHKRFVDYEKQTLSFLKSMVTSFLHAQILLSFVNEVVTLTWYTSCSRWRFSRRKLDHVHASIR